MKFDLNEQIECAVRERGAKSHLMEIEKEIQRRNSFWVRTVSIAASFLIVLTIGIDVKLSTDIREIGYAFNPVDGQSGGSEITALMESKEIKKALGKIHEARVMVADETENPVSDDPDYMIQLQMDEQELDFLEAVCYMRQGKYIKARKALSRIAHSAGYYSHEAEQLLNSL
jgi:hypothetical protein